MWGVLINVRLWCVRKINLWALEILHVTLKHKSKMVHQTSHFQKPAFIQNTLKALNVRWLLISCQKSQRTFSHLGWNYILWTRNIKPINVNWTKCKRNIKPKIGQISGPKNYNLQNEVKIVLGATTMISIAWKMELTFCPTKQKASNGACVFNLSKIKAREWKVMKLVREIKSRKTHFFRSRKKTKIKSPRTY